MLQKELGADRAETNRLAPRAPKRPLFFIFFIMLKKKTQA